MLDNGCAKCREHDSAEAKARRLKRDAAEDLCDALADALVALRDLRRLAFTGSRIPVDRYPERAQADAADTKARAALRKAGVTP